MSNPMESATTETLTDEDLAQVNGGLTFEEIGALLRHYPPTIVPFVPHIANPDFIAAAVRAMTPGPEYHLPEGANDPRNATFFDE
ncbi:MAG: hypothetical protein RL685_3445 [Pseudomonadota bacterium]|jgi:bacteriocin-like protein